ncbi:MAG: FliG C-terminal domain-containing protein [Desulfobacterales bacterium]|nr:FliG C-terminal domain-containing protein [Desulfobacterales bacterium]
MNYDAEFCQQIRVNEAEKRECLALISEILLLATNARNYGLLSLGKEAEENSLFLLRKGLQLALDGVKSQTARTIMELYINTADYSGKELLERCIILEGVIGILEGMHPKLLKEVLVSFLGESGHRIYKDEYEPLQKERLDSYLKKVRDQAAASQSAAELCDLIKPLNDIEIKRFLQVINIDDLSKIIVRLEGGLQTRLFENLPDRGAFLLLDAIEQLNSVQPQEIEEAQDKAVAIIEELKDQDWAH